MKKELTNFQLDAFTKTHFSGCYLDAVALREARGFARAIIAHGIESERLAMLSQAAQVCQNCYDTGIEHGVYKSYPCNFCRPRKDEFLSQAALDGTSPPQARLTLISNTKPEKF